MFLLIRTEKFSDHTGIQVLYRVIINGITFLLVEGEGGMERGSGVSFQTKVKSTNPSDLLFF